MGLKSDFINELCVMFNKTLTKKELFAYEDAFRKIDVNNLDQIRDAIISSSSKFMPRVVDIVRINRGLMRTKGLQNQQNQSEPCAFCDDIGLIPTVIWKKGQPFLNYSLACRCSIGSMYIRSYQLYFNKYPDFQYTWDREEYPKYTDCVHENYYQLKQKWFHSIPEVQFEETPL